MLDLTGGQPARKTAKKKGRLAPPLDATTNDQACSASTLGSPSLSGGGEDSV